MHHSQLLGLNSIEVGKLLHQLVEKHLLNQENKSRWTTYTIQKDGCELSYGDKKGDKKSDKKSDKKNISELNQTELKVLTLITKEASSTYESLSKELALSKTTLYKAVHHLKEMGIISRKGGRKNGFWVILSTSDKKI